MNDLRIIRKKMEVIKTNGTIDTYIYIYQYDLVIKNSFKKGVNRWQHTFGE